METSRINRLREGYRNETRFFQRARKQMAAENLHTLCHFSIAAVALLFCLMLTNFLFVHTFTLDVAYTALLLAQSALCLTSNLAGDRLLKHPSLVHMLVYLYLFSIYAFLIFIGSAVNPERMGAFVAMGVLAFQVPFFLTRLEAPLMALAAGVVYLCISYAHKPFELFRFDAIMVGIGWLVGLLLSVNVCRLRVLDYQHRRHLEALAARDRLTGLYRRETLEQLVDARIQESREDARHAMLMVRMFGLRRVNELYGNDTGDGMLRAAGDMIMETLDLSRDEWSEMGQNAALAGRTNGNEFVLFLSSVHTHAQAERRVHEIAALLEGLPAGDEGRRVLSCETGLALYPEDGLSYGALYRHAEDAVNRNGEPF